VQGTLFEGVDALVREAKLLGDVIDDDGWGLHGVSVAAAPVTLA